MRLVATGIPIQIDGVDVAPQDILVGDDTGIVRVPRAVVENVTMRAAAIDARDRRVREYVEKGANFSDAFKQAGK